MAAKITLGLPQSRMATCILYTLCTPIPAESLVLANLERNFAVQDSFTSSLGMMSPWHRETIFSLMYTQSPSSK